MSIGIFRFTLMFRSQEEKLSEHLQKVATLPDLNSKMEKLGKSNLFKRENNQLKVNPEVNDK